MNVRHPKVIDAAGNSAEHVASEAVGVGHLCGLGATPSVSATGLTTGSGVSLTAGSTDVAGEIVVTTALVSVGVGLAITLAFATPFANRPFVVVSAVTPNAVGTAAANGSPTGFTMTTSVSLAVSSTFRWTYHVVGQAGG